MRSQSDVVWLALSTAALRLRRKRALSCTWELTYRCNARCGICTYWKAASDPGEELTLVQIKAALDKVAAEGCRFVNFTGGEPTLRRDLEDIVGSASRVGMWTSVVSNGSLLSRERLLALKAAGLDNLLLSVDSADASAHDAHRGIPGLHAKVLERLRWISEDFLTGCHTGGMMCVLSGRNVQQIPRLVALAEKLGVYLVVQPYHQNKTGDAGYKAPITAATVSQLLRVKRNSGVLLSSTGYLAGMLGFGQGATRPRCQAGLRYFSIDPHGYLHPCVDAPRVGHVLTDGVAVVRSPQAQGAVSSCSGCWYCFRGEADSTLSFRGYLEKVRLAGSVVVRNAARTPRALVA
jgi:MoaA/NifB/PqqE/SkfB family radical SAM enzyme